VASKSRKNKKLGKQHMNDIDIKTKQQIVDKIKSSTNILVTVSRDPSVDDLSAMLGLTALLNKLGKHATAIFSGAIPPAIDFLEPGKVFENTADSLRDFIIALDKEKADHLRYKVEGDMVKIFITPYRTNITSDDLEFSQGNYNIELVLALGVANQEHLDEALTAHGSILDNVTIATFSVGDYASQLGNLDWNDKNSSSLSEMIATISDSLKADKPLLDKQIATALLTGIVAATDRFSNAHTTSRVMTTAAQLMASGADQQLIAAKLQESHEISELVTNPMEVVSPEVSVEPVAQPTPAEPIIEQSTLPPDNLTIKHEEPEAIALPEIVPSPLPQPQPQQIESNSSSTLPPEEITMNSVSAMPDTSVEPSLGGTLNATADQAAEDSRRELEDQQNKTILTHSYLSAPESPINGVNQTEAGKSVDIFENPPVSTLPTPTEPVLGAMPIVQPPRLDMPLPPPLPDFSTMPAKSTGSFGEPIVMPLSEMPPQPQSIINDPAQFRIPGQY